MNSATRQILSGQYMDIVTRFWGSACIVGAAEDDCWEWSAYLNKDGYGIFSFGQEKVLAHRRKVKEEAAAASKAPAQPPPPVAQAEERRPRAKE